MGAAAYAQGDRIAFKSQPDLHTAAHEAAHVVQQRRGVQLQNGVGEAGDPYERAADAVADRVVAGESAEALLDGVSDGRSSATAVQRKELPGIAADYAQEQTPQSFFDANAASMRDRVVALMATNNLHIGSPYLCWAVGTFGAEVVKSTFGFFPSYGGIKRALVGEDFDGAMRRGFADDQAASSMALELKGLFLSRIATSLKRISPRYVVARHQALLGAEELAKKPVAADSGPQPAESDVLVSHPIDKQVLARFLAGAVKWNDVAQFRKDHPEELKKHVTATIRTPIHLSVTNNRWVKVNDPVDATTEEVAKEMFGTTEAAVYLTPAAPLFGIDPKAWQAYPLSRYMPKTMNAGEIALDAPAGPLTPNKDPQPASAAAGLGGVPGVDKVAAKQSDDLVATGVGAKGVGVRLAMLRINIGEVAKSTGKLGLEHTVAAVLERISKREKELESGVPYSNETITTWDANSKAQLGLVNTASTGVTAAVQSVDSVASPPPALQGGGAARMTFDKLVAPARALARAYLDVIAVSDLPETAATRLAVAEEVHTQFPIEMANAVLEQVRRMLEEASQMAATTKGTVSKTGMGIGVGGDLEKQVRAELVELRATIVADPKAAQKKLGELQAKIQDLLLLAQTAVAAWGLDALIQQLVDHKSKLGSVTGKNDDYDIAIKKLGTFSDSFHTDVFIPFTTGDVDQKKAAAKKFESLKSSPVLTDLQKEMPKFIKEQEEYEQWAAFFLMLGVGFGASALGQVAGAASGFGQGTWQLILVESGVEAAASAAYSTAMEKNPTVGTMVLGFLQSFGNTAFMKAKMPVAKALLEKSIGKGGAEVATLATVFATNATQKIVIALTLNNRLTDEEIVAILRDTAAETLGGALFNHFSEKFLGNLHDKVAEKSALKPKLAVIDQARVALAKESLQLKDHAAAKKSTQAETNKLIEKAKVQTAEELSFLTADLTPAMNQPGSGFDADMLGDVSASLQRTQYQLRKQAVMNRLEHYLGDTYIVQPKDYQQVSADVRELGYVAVGQEDFTVMGVKQRSTRFQPKDGAGAPLEEGARPIRIWENGEPVKAAESTITPEAFAPVITKLATGTVPKVTELPNTAGNIQGHIVCEKIASDPLLADGALASLRTQLFQEVAAKMSNNPPETNLHQVMLDVLNSPAGIAKYHRKGPAITDPKQIQEMGGLVRVVSVQSVIMNRMVTKEFYQRILDVAPPDSGLPTLYAKVEWRHAEIAAKIVMNHKLRPTAGELNMAAVLEGRGAGTSAWYTPANDALPGGAAKAKLNTLVDTLAIEGDYLFGSVIIELPADVAAGVTKVPTKDGGQTTVSAVRPTSLDAAGQGMWFANPDAAAPTGKTAPDPASGVSAAREVIVGPVPLSAVKILKWVGP